MATNPLEEAIKSLTEQLKAVKASTRADNQVTPETPRDPYEPSGLMKVLGLLSPKLGMFAREISYSNDMMRRAREMKSFAKNPSSLGDIANLVKSGFLRPSESHAVLQSVKAAKESKLNVIQKGEEYKSSLIAGKQAAEAYQKSEKKKKETQDETVQIAASRDKMDNRAYRQWQRAKALVNRQEKITASAHQLWSWDSQALRAGSPNITVKDVERSKAVYERELKKLGQAQRQRRVARRNEMETSDETKDILASQKKKEQSASDTARTAFKDLTKSQSNIGQSRSAFRDAQVAVQGAVSSAKQVGSHAANLIADRMMAFSAKRRGAAVATAAGGTRGASASASAGAGTASGTAAIIGGAGGVFTAAIYKFGKEIAASGAKARDFGDSVNEANKRISIFNLNSFTAQMELFMGDLKRDIAKANMTEESSTGLSKAINEMRNSWLGFDASMQDIQNRFATTAAGFSSGFGGPMSGFMTGLDKLVKSTGLGGDKSKSAAENLGEWLGTKVSVVLTKLVDTVVDINNTALSIKDKVFGTKSIPLQHMDPFAKPDVPLQAINDIDKFANAIANMQGVLTRFPGNP